MLSPRKLEATSAQNIEFLQVIAKREEAIHQSQLRLEEKTRECGTLARQLESAIEDARRQVSLNSITNLSLCLWTNRLTSLSLSLHLRNGHIEVVPAS